MTSMRVTLTDEQRALKAGVAEICKRYPGEYWRDLDTRREYPEKFVQELTRAGYLAAILIRLSFCIALSPQFGGRAILPGVESRFATLGTADAAAYPELRFKNAKVCWLNSLTSS